MYGWYSEKQRGYAGAAVYALVGEVASGQLSAVWDGVAVVEVTEVTATRDRKPSWSDAVPIGEVGRCVTPARLSSLQWRAT